MTIQEFERKSFNFEKKQIAFIKRLESDLKDFINDKEDQDIIELATTRLKYFRQDLKEFRIIKRELKKEKKYA